MSAAPKHEIPAGLSRSLKSSGAEITDYREIDHATQYRLSRGAEIADLNVYHTGKILPGGKDSGLKRLLESWRMENGGTNSVASNLKQG